MEETTINEIETIANAIYKKSKRTFAYRENELKRQAEYFSPLYRDFILKLINNNSLKIINKYNDGYLHPNCDKDASYFSLDINEKNVTNNDFRKKAKNLLVTSIDDVEVLPHELGHAADFYFGYYATLTKNVVLFDNKTLYEIFTEEFQSKKEELFDMIMREYKEIINSNINENAYDIISNNIDKYHELLSLSEFSKEKNIKNRRKALQEELYNVGFVETYYSFVTKKCSSILNFKYSPILDALSSEYNLKGLYLNYHNKEYYDCAPLKAVQEFFANLFAMEVTNNREQMSTLQHHLPKSLEGFEKLFNLFYEHIQNNKRFKDIPLKK